MKRSLQHQDKVPLCNQTKENPNVFPRHLSIRLAQLFALSRTTKAQHLSPLVFYAFPFFHFKTLKSCNQDYYSASNPVHPCLFTGLSIMYLSALFISESQCRAMYTSRESESRCGPLRYACCMYLSCAPGQ